MNKKTIIFNFIASRKWSYIIGTIVLIGTTILSSTIPSLLGNIMDALEDKVPQDSIIRLVVLMLFFVIASFLLRFFWRFLLIGNARNVEVYLRDMLFRHLLSLPQEFYNKNKTGDIVARAINDIQAIRMLFGFGYIALLEGVIINTVSIFFMIQKSNVMITLVAVAPVPFVILIMTKLRRVIRQRFTKVQDAYSEIADKVQENITGIRVIKAFAQEEEEVSKFQVYNQKRMDAQMSLTRVSAFLGPSSQFFFGISILFFIIFGSRLVANDSITIGDYIAFNTYVGVIMGPINNVSRIVEIWQRAFASFDRLGHLLFYPVKIPFPEKVTEKIFLDGDIKINNLTFKYPTSENPVLKDINLHLYKGQTLGILGRTGSGKTTLVNLLMRMYEVEDGRIFIDGKDINSYPPHELRESFGYVPQDNFLFSVSIRENIQFFREIYTDEEIYESTKLSCVYKDIEGFPDKFETVVGERGVTLSGGQKQRVSIARAVVKKPDILILDDSLSAVDSSTEKTILSNIKSVLHDKTGLIISHRVSTVMHADVIIFLEDGEIAEKGNHEELMDLKGRYYDLYNVQEQ